MQTDLSPYGLKLEHLPDAWREHISDALGTDNWFNVRVVDRVAHVHIFGEIGFGKHWRDLIEQLGSVTDVKLTINSTGGDSITGINLFHELSGRVSETTIVGKCYSAAVPIALAGRRIKMERSAKILIHAIQTFVYAPVKQLSFTAKVLQDLSDDLHKIIIERTELPGHQVAKWLTSGDDFYLSAEIAKSYGLIDEIFDVPKISNFSAPPAGKLVPTISEPKFTDEENLFLDFLAAFGRFPVHNRAAFIREVTAHLTYNTDQPNL